MGTTFAGIAQGGPLAVAVVVSAVAGLVSFLSPCVLPLVPGYLSYVTGMAGADLDAQGRIGQPGGRQANQALGKRPVRLERVRRWGINRERGWSHHHGDEALQEPV